jgi:uncharacterized protein
LTRRPAQVTGLPTGVRAVGWDGATAQGWGALADGADAIINLAGESIGDGRWTAERKARIVSSRVNAGQAVSAAIQSARQKPQVLIQSSAVGYYGPQHDELLDETAPAGQDYLARVAEQWEASSQAVEAHGVRRVIIRTGVVLSPAGGALPRLVLPFRFFVGGPMGGGKQWLPWIHMADEVGAIRFLMDRPDAQGAFNLAAPNPVTNATFAHTLGRVMRRPALIPVPAFVLRLLLGEMATVVLDGQRQVPKRLLRLGYTFKFPALEPALRDLVR